MPSTASLPELRAEFDEIAALTPASPTLASAERWIAENLPVGRGAVLDVGCGVGDLVRRLAPYFERAEAIDLSPGMIDEARRRTSPDLRITFSCADLFEWLGQRPDSYDCIVSVAALSLKNPRPALR